MFRARIVMADESLTIEGDRRSRQSPGTLPSLSPWHPA